MRLSGREPVAALRLGCSASCMETPETCVLGRVAQLVAFQLSPCHIEDTCMIMVEKIEAAWFWYPTGNHCKTYLF